MQTGRERCSHTLVQGETGVGKTVFLMNKLYSQALAGGGFIFVDGKPSKETFGQVCEIARMTNRRHDLRVLDLSGLYPSHSFNPCRHGNADEIVSMVMMLRSIASDKGDQYFTEVQEDFLKSLVELLVARRDAFNEVFHLGDILRCITEPTKALNALLALEDTEWSYVDPYDERARVQAYVRKGLKGNDTYLGPRHPAVVAVRETMTNFGWPNNFEKKRFAYEISVIGKRIHKYLVGRGSQYLTVHEGELDFRDAILENRFVYVPIPMLSAAYTAQSTARLVLVALQVAIGNVLSSGTPPMCPMEIVLDECGYFFQEARLLQQARAARCAFTVCLQTLAQFRAHAKNDYLERDVLQNTRTQVYFRCGDYETAKQASEQCKEQLFRVPSRSESEGEGIRRDEVEILGSKQKSRQRSRNEKVQREPRIPPDEFMELHEKGEAIVLIKGRDAYRVQTPYLEFPNDVEPVESLPEVDPLPDTVNKLGIYESVHLSNMEIPLSSSHSDSSKTSSDSGGDDEN